MKGISIVVAPVLVFVALIAAAPARADIIAQYTFPTTAGETGPGYNPTTVAANLDAGFDMAVKDTNNQLTIEISNPTPIYATQPVLRVDPDGHANSATAAVANGVYFEFAVKPADLYQLALSNLTFNAARGGTGTPRGWMLRSSADGFAANLGGQDIGTYRPSFTNYSVDLSAGEFQSLTGPITFRMYVYSPGDGSTIEFDDITLNGTLTPVPEPGTFALLASAALLGLAAFRRRRR